MRYPLDVVWSHGDGGFCLWSKGHHPCEAFLVEAERSYGDLDNFDEPLHQWWRFVPDPPESDYRGRYWDATPGTPGTFPVTVMERR